MNKSFKFVESEDISHSCRSARHRPRVPLQPALEINFAREGEGRSGLRSSGLTWSRRALAMAASLMVVGSSTFVQTVPAADGFPEMQSPMNSEMAKIKPLGLDMAGDVYRAASDPGSAAFFEQSLPAISAFLNSHLSETKAMDDTTRLLDPAQLRLTTGADVRIYFVGEGAGYANTLGINTTGSGVASGDPQVIFPDASTKQNYSGELKPQSGRTPQTPLVPGDFVDLGKLSGGTQLDFFLIADGANGGKNVYTANAASNPDGINHVVSFAYTEPGSSYLVLGFEELYGGGDRDFNDLLFAVDIGAANVAALTATPEPGTWLMLGTLTGVVGWTRRRLGRTPEKSV